MELEIDTQSGGTCFFCLKIDNIENIQEETNNYFRLILRYLQLLPWKIYPQNETKRFKQDVQVDLCHECQVILREFGEIYIIFEETVLHLNALLTKLYAEMDTKTQSEWSNQDLEKIGGFRNLRELIMRRCQQKLQFAMPRVRLERLPNLKRKFPSKSSSPPPTPEFRVKYEPFTQDEELEEAEEMFQNIDDRISMSPPPSPPPPVISNPASDSQSDLGMEQLPMSRPTPEAEESFKKLRKSDFGEIFRRLQPTLSKTTLFPLKQLSCQYCQRKFQGARRGQSYKLHLVNFHRFHFFSNIRLEHVPLDKFVEMIDHVVNLCTSIKGNCSLCRKSYQAKREISQQALMRQHLFKTHHKTLEKALLKVQDNPELLTTSFSIEEDEEDKQEKEFKERRCVHCGKNFLGHCWKTLFRAHLASVHRDLLFLHIKKEEVTQYEFSRIINHLLQFYIKDNNCTLCPISYNNKTLSKKSIRTKRHLLEDHQRTFEEALVQVQDNPELLKTTFKIVKKDKKRKRGKITDKIEEVQVLCNYCGQKFQGHRKDDFFMSHLIKQHAEHFFLEIKKENVSQDEFSYMIKHIMQFHIKKNNICSLCPPSSSEQGGDNFSKSLGVRQHLLEKHLQTLEKALVDVQDNPELLDTCFRIDYGEPLPQSPYFFSMNRNKQVLCQYCGREFVGNNKDNNFRRHLTRNHVDHFFPNIKKEHVSQAEFTNMIGKVINLCIKDDKCSLCSYSKRWKQSSSVRIHLVRNHRRTLEKALVKVQDNLEFIDSQSHDFKIEEDEDDKTEDDKEELLCQHCDKIFQGPRRFIVYRCHLVSFHKEHFFPNLGNVSLSKAELGGIIDEVLHFHIRNDNCALCPIRYSRKKIGKQLLMVKKHLLIGHRGTIEEALVKAMGTPEKLSNTSTEIGEDGDEGDEEGPPAVISDLTADDDVNGENDEDDEVSKSSPLEPPQLLKRKCNPSFSNEEEVVEVAVELFDSQLSPPPRSSSPPPTTFKEPDCESEINSYVEPSNEITCQHCHQIFKGRTMNEKFKQHLITSHIHHFLPNVKKVNVTQVEFNEMVHHVLQLCIKKDNCALCPKIYKNKFRPIQLLNVKLHLLEEHQGTVKRAVAKVQVTPELLNSCFDVLEDDDEEEEHEGLPAVMEELPDNDMENMLESPGYQPPSVQSLKSEPCSSDEEVDETYEPEASDNPPSCLSPSPLPCKKCEPKTSATTTTATTSGYYSTTIFKESVPLDVKEILCQYCGKKFKGMRKTEKFKIHLTINHISHFFPDIQKASSTENEADFIEMILKIINLCIKGDNCSLCSKEYKIKHRPMQLLTVKLHLLQDHQRTLEKALKKVLDNPELLKNKGFRIEEDLEDKKADDLNQNQNQSYSQLLCQFCGFKYYRPKQHQHMVIHHIEKFFPNVEGDKVPKDEFLQMIQHVINLCIKEDNCSLCSKIKNASRSTQLLFVKQHLLRNHFKTLEKALIKVVDNPKLLDSSFEIVEEEEDKERINWTWTGVNASVLCKYCDHKFEGNGSNKRHLVHLMTHHKEHFFPNVRKENVTQAQFDKMINYVLRNNFENDKCSLCSKSFELKYIRSKFFYVKFHLLRYHQEELKNALVQLQDNPDSCNFEMQIKASRSGHRGPWAKLGIIPPGKDASCPICNRKYGSSVNLKFHVLLKHKNHLFRKSRKDHVTEKQFQVLIEHLVFMSFIDKCTCTLCSKVIDKGKGSNAKKGNHWLRRLKIHLFQSHHKSVMERLEEIQEDSKLLQKIDKCILVCKCGVLCMTKEEVKGHRRRCGASYAYGKLIIAGRQK